MEENTRKKKKDVRMFACGEQDLRKGWMDQETAVSSCKSCHSMCFLSIT